MRIVQEYSPIGASCVDGTHIVVECSWGDANAVRKLVHQRTVERDVASGVGMQSIPVAKQKDAVPEKKNPNYTCDWIKEGTFIPGVEGAYKKECCRPETTKAAPPRCICTILISAGAVDIAPNYACPAHYPEVSR